MRIDQQCMLEFGRTTNGNGVPLIIIQMMWDIVFYANGTITQIEYVMNMAIDELHGDEILAFASVVHYEALMERELTLKFLETLVFHVGS